MKTSELNIIEKIEPEGATLVVGFSGWMDGGDVSTATVEYFIDKLDAKLVAEVRPGSFYINSFPGAMDITALFRPHTEIEDGVVIDYELPENQFYYSEKYNTMLLLGTEPNINWDHYSDVVMGYCRDNNIKTIYFIGSVAGLIPHTRKPRFFCTVSSKKIKKKIEKFGIKYSNYEGPSSITTHMTLKAAQWGISMISIIAEIPAYIQGHNPKCIDEVVKMLSVVLGLHIEHKDLKKASEQFEKKVTEIVANHPELDSHISKLEEDYDNEVFDTEMSDVKEWLQKQGIRVD